MLQIIRQTLGAALLAATATAAVSAATPGQPQLAMSFELKGERGEVAGVLTAPLTDTYQNPLPENLKIDIDVFRSSHGLNQIDLPVGKFTGMAPGESVTFTDRISPAWEFNEEYTYTAVAKAGDYFFYTGYGQMIPGLEFMFDRDALTLTAGLSDVEISVIVPSKMTTGMPLEQEIESMEFYRAVDMSSWPYKYALIHSVANPEMEETITYTDTKPFPDTRNYYRVRAVTKYGFAEVNGNCYVGEDIPAAPYPVTAQQTAEGVTVSWTAPDRGENWGVIDPQSLWYNVFRCYGYGNDERELIATHISETSFTDTGEGIEKPLAVRYEVQSGNSKGTGGSNFSSYDYDLIIGPAYRLPFSETFDGGLTKEWLMNASDNRATWYTATFAEYGDRPVVRVNPYQGSGLIYVDYIYNSPASGSTNTLTSYKIDMKDMENPWISFWYYAIPDNDVWISVAASDDAGSFGEGKLIRISENVDKAEWRRALLPLENVGGSANAYLRFTTGFDDAPSSAILDDVLVLNYPTVSNIDASVDEETMTATVEWTLPVEGSAECLGFVGYVDGEEYGEVSSPWSYPGLEMDRVYTFQVRPLYEDVEVEASVAVAVNVATPVESEFTVGDYDYVVMDTLDDDASLPKEVCVAGYHGRGGLLRMPATVTYSENLYTVRGVGEEAFAGNASVESVTMPDGYTFIHRAAFRDATALEALSLPASMTVIGEEAFSGCSALEMINFAGEVPPAVAGNAFEGIAEYCKGTCPEGTEKTYSETPGLTEIDFGYNPDAGVGEIGSDETGDLYFDLQGRRIPAPLPGQTYILVGPSRQDKGNPCLRR